MARGGTRAFRLWVLDPLRAAPDLLAHSSRLLSSPGPSRAHRGSRTPSTCRCSLLRPGRFHVAPGLGMPRVLRSLAMERGLAPSAYCRKCAHDLRFILLDHLLVGGNFLVAIAVERTGVDRDAAVTIAATTGTATVLGLQLQPTSSLGPVVCVAEHPRTTGRTGSRPRPAARNRNCVSRSAPARRGA